MEKNIKLAILIIIAIVIISLVITPMFTGNAWYSYLFQPVTQSTTPTSPQRPQPQQTACMDSTYPTCNGVCSAGWTCKSNSSLPVSGCYCNYCGGVTYLSCFDSDGKNPNTVGFVSGQYKDNCKGVISNYRYDDVCAGIQAGDYWCNGNSFGGVTVYNCPHGCLGGACV